MLSDLAVSILLLVSKPDLNEIQKYIDKPKILIKYDDYKNAKESYYKDLEKKRIENEDKKKDLNIERKQVNKKSSNKENVASRGSKNETIKLDIVVSHYCSCSKCNGKWTGQPTRSGKQAKVGRTIATPPDLLGKKLYIKGYGNRIAEDTGNGDYIKWIKKGKKVKIDMYVKSHEEAMEKGIVNTYGYLLD